jgi:hypothetical protein
MAPGDSQAGRQVQSPPTQPAGPAELGRSTRARSWTLPRIVFWSGLLVFVAARLTQAIVPALYRAEPAEMDDSYRYLGQAQVMSTCAGGGCPGLDAIEKQMSEGPTDAPTAFERLRTQIHLFTYFHPLYSLVLTGLRSLGLGVPQAYNLASISFGLMLCMAIGLWLGSVWGPAPAGIALGLLAFYQLPGQGFHFVPATFALGWAAISWALILKPMPGLYILLPFLWIASLATHAIGLFYVAAALLMLLGMTRLPIDRRTRNVLGAGIVLILGRLAVALLWPSLGLSGDAGQFYGSATPWFEAIRSGLAELADLVARWGATFWRLGATAALVAVGLVASRRDERRRVGVTGLALGAILFISVLYHHPVHGSTATGRIWLSVAIFLVGAISNGIFFFSTTLASWIARPQQAKLSRRQLVIRGAQVVILGVLIGRALATNLRYSATSYPAAIEKAITKENLDLGEGEALRGMLADGSGNATLYLDEVALYHAVTYNGLQSEAVYAPILYGEDQLREWVTNNPRLALAAGVSPLAGLESITRGAVPVGKDLTLEISGPADPALTWSAVKIENSGGAAELAILFKGHSTLAAETLPVPAGYSGWLTLPRSLLGVSEFSVSTTPSTGPLLVRGLRVSGQDNLYWPWDQGVSLKVLNSHEPNQADQVWLSTSNMADELGLDLEVVSDDYSILVARILR